MPIGPNDIDLTGKTMTFGSLTGCKVTLDAFTPYDATAWLDNLDVPTKAAIRDKFESLPPPGAVADADYGDVAVSGTGTVFTVQTIGGATAIVSAGALGTPASGTLTNCSGLPAAGVVGTALVTGGALGTPASGTLTSCGGLPAAGVVGTALVTGGALGTPSGGTLTSCTGLPIAGLVASTSTALGVGSIELGHATDTTISRIGAGIAGVEGKYLNSESYSFVPTGADLTLANDNSLQPYLPAAADTLTVLANTTYFFETMIYWTNSATVTTHTTAWSLKGNGNATIANTLWSAWCCSNVIGTQLATTTQTFGNVETAVVLNATNTVAGLEIYVTGQFRVSTVGSIQPCIKFSAAPANTNLSKAGTYFRCWPVGTDTTASVGAWA